eukprot:TRINITY_DN71316_c0_g1_i1.p1 TRINITY_DN71316_c0_g1~~TRINITY_DN71316_c0_g1_i1.p1  ORF type:complete len:252 (+),score=26.71 TRINITY_DN71316_c0_g1_i1:72-827(+)
MAIYCTSLARLNDGLPLCQEYERLPQVNLPLIKSLLQQYVTATTPESSQRHTVDADDVMYHVLIADGVIFVAATSRALSADNASLYLETIHREFNSVHGQTAARADRPYACDRFDAFIRRTRRSMSDQFRAGGPGSADLQKLRSELDGVHQVMRANIHDVLSRGEALSSMTNAGAALRAHSKQYAADAARLNRHAWLKKWLPFMVLGAILGLFVCYAAWRVSSVGAAFAGVFAPFFRSSHPPVAMTGDVVE